MVTFSLEGSYSMTADSSFHLLSGETIHSMLALKNDKYLCAVRSGSLQMIGIKAKTATHYANKFKGRFVQCIVAFPDFNEDSFPLVLIKEWEFVVIFNIKLKQYTKVVDVDTECEDNWAMN